MKKLLLIAAVAVFGFTNVNAQDENTTGGFEEGDVYVSGTVGYNSTKEGDLKTNRFDFMPTVGYFVSENIALEANLSIGSAENAADDKTTTFGGGLGATYFFTPANQFSFTVGAGVSYANSKFEPNGGGESKLDVFAIAVGPGLNYFVSDCFALRASVGALSYISAKPDADGAESANSFGLNLDLSDINFGVTYKF
ncbi:outer membrane beta-barrel protein [Psychroserpens luteolus]|uniref:outer membrane beta-barrel protein n=1 Tax=Psychroserpens luteolus TaxID=2855840 RepID=UPI001E283A48|nr:outer membrane beta-barrel protein [Psychroserpens luteolus]MCD2259357.1 porin family protein [Psychroserpens luteolus]